MSLRQWVSILYEWAIYLAQALVHDSTNISELWHKRLAHLNYQALPTLRNMVTGLAMLHVDHDGVCRWCAFGKNTKGSFLKSESRSKGILDLVHSDLCKPMTFTWFSGYNYYVTFIDDHSRKTWIYFLKTKESKEVLNKFKEFKAQVENLSKTRIKILRSDNGGEYTSTEFDNFWKKKELRGSYELPTILNKMGLLKGRTEQLWRQPKPWYMTRVYQCSCGKKHHKTVVYVQNRCPHKSLKNMALEEAFTGVNPEVGHLCILGFPVYIHMPKD